MGSGKRRTMESGAIFSQVTLKSQADQKVPPRPPMANRSNGRGGVGGRPEGEARRFCYQ